MSELGQLERFLLSDDALGLWEQRYQQRSQVEPENGAPDPRKVRYIGVMSAAYPRSAGVNYTPVESGVELFSSVPEGEDYAYIGSQIAAQHAVAGKVAIPFEWSTYHTSISGLAYGMIRVLVAFLLTQLEDGVLPPALPAGGEANDAALVRKDLTPEVWAKADDCYDLLCRMFGEIHDAYYGEYPGKYTERIPQILRRNQLVADALSTSLSEEGNQALQILLKLGGRWDRTWVAGFRELGIQVMYHDKGMFRGDAMALWFLAIQEEFEFSCRLEVASYLWMQERERQRANEED